MFRHSKTGFCKIHVLLLLLGCGTVLLNSCDEAESTTGKPIENPLPETAPTWQAAVPDTILASSYLQNSANEFDENYHPFYVLDDEVNTAWITDFSEQSEKWIELRFDVEDVRAIALEVWNGYQKTEALFHANARVQNAIFQINGPDAYQHIFSDTNGVQNVEFELHEPVHLKTLRFKIHTTFAGSKYSDCGISGVKVRLLTNAHPDTVNKGISGWITEHRRAGQYMRSPSPYATSGYEITQIFGVVWEGFAEEEPLLARRRPLELFTSYPDKFQKMFEGHLPSEKLKEIQSTITKGRALKSSPKFVFKKRKDLYDDDNPIGIGCCVNGYFEETINSLLWLSPVLLKEAGEQLYVQRFLYINKPFDTEALFDEKHDCYEGESFVRPLQISVDSATGETLVFTQRYWYAADSHHGDPGDLQDVFLRYNSNGYLTSVIFYQDTKPVEEEIVALFEFTWTNDGMIEQIDEWSANLDASEGGYINYEVKQYRISNKPPQP